MAEAAPYLFDRMFEVSSNGSDISEVTAAQKLREDWERKLAEACLTSFEEGQAAGKAETLQRLEADTLEQTKQLVSRAEKIFAAVERECGQIRHNAIQIASMTANLLAGELITRHPTLNTEALFRDALEYAGDAPHIAITVNDAHAEQIQKAVTMLAAERGFTGKLVILGDPETKTGDCALQWADGGSAFELKKIRDTIHKLVRDHLDRLKTTTKNPDSETTTQAEQPNENASGQDAGPGETP